MDVVLLAMAKRIPATFPRARTAFKEFGERLRLARLRRRMTQAELAARVDVSLPTVAKIERGDPSATFATVLRILSVLGMAGDIDQLAKNDPLGRELQDVALKTPSKRRSAADV